MPSGESMWASARTKPTRGDKFARGFGFGASRMSFAERHDEHVLLSRPFDCVLDQSASRASPSRLRPHGQPADVHPFGFGHRAPHTAEDDVVLVDRAPRGAALDVPDEALVPSVGVGHRRAEQVLDGAGQRPPGRRVVDRRCPHRHHCASLALGVRQLGVDDAERQRRVDACRPSTTHHRSRTRAPVARAAHAARDGGAHRPRRLGELTDAMLSHFVDQCRRSGHSWAEIGGALGVTKQAVQKRFTRSGRAGGLGAASPSGAAARARARARRGRVARPQLGRHRAPAPGLLRRNPRRSRRVSSRTSASTASRSSPASTPASTRRIVGQGSAHAARVGGARVVPRARRSMLGHNYVGTEHSCSRCSGRRRRRGRDPRRPRTSPTTAHGRRSSSSSIGQIVKNPGRDETRALISTCCVAYPTSEAAATEISATSRGSSTARPSRRHS